MSSPSRRNLVRQHLHLDFLLPHSYSLFVTMAGLIVHALFPSLIEPELWKRFEDAMVVACEGQAMRQGGKDGDDLWPSYSNVRTH